MSSKEGDLTMGDCRRVQDEWSFDRDELDPELAQHVRGCADCQKIWQANQDLMQGLGDVGAQYEPSPRLREALWQQLGATVSEPKSSVVPIRRRGAWVAGVSMAVAVAAALIVTVVQRPPPPPFSYRVLTGATAVRSEGGAAVGDRLRIDVEAKAGVAVRVYFNREERLVDCPASPSCERRGPRSTVIVPFERPGVYEIVFLNGRPPLPVAVSVDRDIASASRSGIDYELIELEVR